MPLTICSSPSATIGWRSRCGGSRNGSSYNRRQCKTCKPWLRRWLHGSNPSIVNASAIDVVTRDLRGQACVRVKGRTENLIVSRPFSHLFKQM